MKQTIMIIEEHDFRLTPSEGINSFNLELMHTVKPKGGEPRNEFKNAGYGLMFESAMRKIISYRIEKKRGDDTITLKDYIEDYRTEVEKIKSLVKL